jgi:hypothetical protein
MNSVRSEPRSHRARLIIECGDLARLRLRPPSGSASLVPWNRDVLHKSRERGARMARRDDRAYWAYVREEQRRQPGCPARELCDTSRFQGTRR